MHDVTLNSNNRQVIARREATAPDASGFFSKMTPLHLLAFANSNAFRTAMLTSDA
jgi:hypothetical protein